LATLLRLALKLTTVTAEPMEDLRMLKMLKDSILQVPLMLMVMNILLFPHLSHAALYRPHLANPAL
jgi:hypothetical protein